MVKLIVDFLKFSIEILHKRGQEALPRGVGIGQGDQRVGRKVDEESRKDV